MATATMKVTNSTWASGAYLQVSVTYTASTANSGNNQIHTMSATKVTYKPVGMAFQASNQTQVSYAGTVLHTLSDSSLILTSGTSKSYTISKSVQTTMTHSTQTKSFVTTHLSKSFSTSISVPAKASYTVAINANGGSGGVTSTTKWYGEELSLSLLPALQPTRSGWKYLGLNASSSATSAQASIAANDNGTTTTVYAIWERQITGITLEVDTLRVADGTSTSESDDGTWCYGTCDYAVTGAAAGTLTLTVSVSPSGPSIQTSTFTASKTADTELTGSIVFRASNCSTDDKYTFTVSASCTNSSATQTAVTKSLGDILSAAFYPMGILGDSYLYNLTADTSIDSSKTYYALSNGEYSPVSSPAVADIGSYYEANGPRPGHGVSFFGPCRDEGMQVVSNDTNVQSNTTGRPGDEGGVYTALLKTIDTTQNTTLNHRIVTAKDVNGRAIGSMLARRSANGDNAVMLEAHNVAGNSAVYSAIYVGANDDGTKWASLSSGVAWPVANGGTGDTGVVTYTTVSTVISASSGWTITSVNFARWGKVGMFVIQAKKSSAISIPANGDMTDDTVGTLKSGFRTKYNTAGTSLSGGGLWFTIGTGGEVTLAVGNATGSARSISANTTLTLRSPAYILA